MDEEVVAASVLELQGFEKVFVRLGQVILEEGSNALSAGRAHEVVLGETIGQ